MKSFEQWLAEYLPFRDEVKAITDKTLPDDIASLQYEATLLAAYESQAETHSAMGESVYQKRKGEEMDLLRKDGWPKSTIDAYAKTKCHVEIFYRMESFGLCNVIKSRAIKCATFVKQLRP